MQPIKVTAVMLTGKVATSDRYLPLDSILAYSWIAENHPESLTATQSNYLSGLIEPDLPLEKRGQDDNWYWACSFACGEVRKEEIVYWHKRFDQKAAEEYVDFGGRRGAVDTHSGTYKGYRIPLVTILVPSIEWYAVGCPQEVLRLLRRITHIGKKRSQGFGQVARWTVEPWHEDLSWLRPVPDSDGQSELGIRPPYWLMSVRRKVTIPDDPRLLCMARW